MPGQPRRCFRFRRVANPARPQIWRNLPVPNTDTSNPPADRALRRFRRSDIPDVRATSSTGGQDRKSSRAVCSHVVVFQDVFSGFKVSRLDRFLRARSIVSRQFSIRWRRLPPRAISSSEANFCRREIEIVFPGRKHDFVAPELYRPARYANGFVNAARFVAFSG